MTVIRALVWAGVAGWLLVALNFIAGFLLRQSLLRFTFALAALGATAFLYHRLMGLPYEVRVVLDIALSMGGSFCGVALTATLVQRGWRVLR